MKKLFVDFRCMPLLLIKKVVLEEFVNRTVCFLDMHLSKKKTRKTDLPGKVVSKYVEEEMQTYQHPADQEASSQINHDVTALLLHSGYSC